MKKLNGIMLLIISIAITTIGSVLKIMRQITISEILLGIGMITFVIALGMILYKLLSSRTE